MVKFSCQNSLLISPIFRSADGVQLRGVRSPSQISKKEKDLAQADSGIRALLRQPWAYNMVQRAIGAQRTHRIFIERYLRPSMGDRILDIGCGPASILAQLPDVHYVGYDPNPDYIAHARLRYGNRGSFHIGAFDTRAVESYQGEPFDIVLLCAVLHHLDDEIAERLFGNLVKVVKPGGQIITLDNVYVENQNPLARLIISMDRGRNVRTAEGYQALAMGHFSGVTGEILHKAFPPYTYWIMTVAAA